MAVPMHKVKIAQIISRQVLTVGPDTPLSEAVAVMAGTRISCLVVTVEGKPVGIFTERDLLKAAGRGVTLDGSPVRELMTSRVVTIPGNISLYQAYDLLLTNKIRHHVMVDSAGKVVGVLSQSDLIDHLGFEYFVELRKIEQVMSIKVVTVAGKIPVREVLRRMAKEPLSCVVVAAKGRPLGILTERDVARLLMEGADLAVVPVEEVMSRPVLTVSPQTTVHQAAAIM